MNKEKTRGISGKLNLIRIPLLGCLFAILMSLGCFGISAKASIVSTSHQKYNYSELCSDLTALQKKYPAYMSYKSIGHTADNRQLYEVTLGNPDAKKHLVVIANLHAREYMTTQLVMRQLEYYLDSYDTAIGGHKVKNVVNDVCIHIVPSCNPDGTAISQYGFKAIRNKSLRKKLKKMGGSSRTWKANARGVDLNRNWNIAFKKAGKAGALGYRGTRAESELEVQAILGMVSEIKKKGTVVGIVSYHSTGSILYGKVLSSASSYVKNNTGKMSALAKSMTGYKLMPVESIAAGRGCSREYFLYKAGIPFITIEVGRGACPLGTKEFSSIWKKNKNLVIREALLFFDPNSVNQKTPSTETTQPSTETTQTTQAN